MMVGCIQAFNNDLSESVLSIDVSAAEKFDHQFHRILERRHKWPRKRTRNMEFCSQIDIIELMNLG